MGQDISKIYSPPPLKLRDCVVDDVIKDGKYYEFLINIVNKLLVLSLITLFDLLPSARYCY